MPDSTIALGDLEQSYNGPLPPPALAAALLGGGARRDRLQAAAEERLHARLAAAAWQATVGRRRLAPPDPARADPWLARLAATLAYHRQRALAWRTLAATGIRPRPRPLVDAP